MTEVLGITSKARVTLYSVDWCGWCLRARAWLDEHGVVYGEIEVQDLQPERHEVLDGSGQYEEPVIQVELGSDRHVFLDEQHPELAKLLGISM